MLDETIKKSVYELLAGISEALEHLQHTENEELRQVVAMGRRQVTAALDNALACSLDKRIDAASMPDDEWLVTAYRIMEQIAEPFRPQNAFDAEFQRLLDYIWAHSRAELVGRMKHNLFEMKKASKANYNAFVTYFARFPLWGTINPKQEDYNTFELRAEVLKWHSYDFLWLYRRLEDYLSKRTLAAILINWAFLDLSYPQMVKSIFPDYWEPDIFPSNDNDVFVDVGAYVGDSIQQYVNVYGKGYKKIYAYEISADSYKSLCQNVKEWRLHDVITKRKGAGAEPGEFFVQASSDPSANQLRQEGSEQQRVEVVPIDDDIEDTVTFLKMDIEGAEQDALLGCSRIIREQQPKLAICTYHGYDDIWQVPTLIDNIRPDYHFYMRHYGGNLVPTEFVLLARP